jgi:hypothetical protein
MTFEAKMKIYVTFSALETFFVTVTNSDDSAEGI